MNALDWQDQASCNGHDPSVFFGAEGVAMTEPETERAKRICAICPVREACLEFALSTNQKHGVWGGAGEVERRRMKCDRNPRSTARRQEASRLAAIGTTLDQIAAQLGVSHRQAQRYVTVLHG